MRARTRMHPDLTAILSADEEARESLAIVERELAAKVAVARAQAAEALESARRRAAEALAAEVLAIQEEADRVHGEARRRRAAQREARGVAAAAARDDGVAVFLQMVGGTGVDGSVT
ncbi:MAG TPA: hypothetical protein VLD67_03510 [Vicinamibacterales bacterium]|nr:hypothetical protein [Vicinamibacterales bacterium]